MYTCTCISHETRKRHCVLSLQEYIKMLKDVGMAVANTSGLLRYLWGEMVFGKAGLQAVLSLSCSSNGRATVIHRRCVCWLPSRPYKSKGLSCIESFEIPVHTCSKLNSMLTSSCCSLVCYETHLLHLEGLFR